MGSSFHLLFRRQQSVFVPVSLSLLIQPSFHFLRHLHGCPLMHPSHLSSPLGSLSSCNLDNVDHRLKSLGVVYELYYSTPPSTPPHASSFCSFFNLFFMCESCLSDISFFLSPSFALLVNLSTVIFFSTSLYFSFL